MTDIPPEPEDNGQYRLQLTVKTYIAVTVVLCRNYIEFPLQTSMHSFDFLESKFIQIYTVYDLHLEFFSNGNYGKVKRTQND